MTHPAQKDVDASHKRQTAWVEGRARGGKVDRPGRAFGGAAERPVTTQSKVDNYPTQPSMNYRTRGYANGGATDDVTDVTRDAETEGKHPNWRPSSTSKDDDFAKGGGIHIKPANRGKLHAELGVPQGKKIPVAKMERAKAGASPAERKRITFAENARKWGK